MILIFGKCKSSILSKIHLYENSSIWPTCSLPQKRGIPIPKRLSQVIELQLNRNPFIDPITLTRNCPTLYDLRYRYVFMASRQGCHINLMRFASDWWAIKSNQSIQISDGGSGKSINSHEAITILLPRVLVVRHKPHFVYFIHRSSN